MATLAAVPINPNEAAEEALGAGESVSETAGEVFSGYVCATLSRGIEHPGDVAEVRIVAASAA